MAMLASLQKVCKKRAKKTRKTIEFLSILGDVCSKVLHTFCKRGVLQTFANVLQTFCKRLQTFCKRAHFANVLQTFCKRAHFCKRFAHVCTRSQPAFTSGAHLPDSDLWVSLGSFRRHFGNFLDTSS